MTDETSRAWELIKDIGFAMLITHDGEKLDARPMSATPDTKAGRILFNGRAASQAGRNIA